MNDDLMKLYTTVEDLHPDLVPYLCKVKGIGTALKHPLYFHLFYTPQMNAVINRGYVEKKKYVEEKMAAKKYSSVFSMYERAHRLEMFAEMRNLLTDDEYWECLSWIWTDSENLWQYRHILTALLTSKRPGREKMMDEDERKLLASLPDEFVVYRGHQGVNRSGHSWTFSYGTARWFANRLTDNNKVVSRAIVKKKDVIACLLGRNEYEIVVLPENLKIENMRKLVRPDWMQSALDEAWEGFALSKNKSAHGLWHWDKVERNAIALADRTPKCDKLVVRLFAILHDCKRENENEDPEHGARAAVYVQEIYNQGKLKINQSQLDKLMEACRLHNDGQVSSDPTIGVCWDADRLDLPRVGIAPDPALLSTEASKEVIWRI